MMKMIRLTKRLSAIAGYIEKGASVADIGTDHGYIPVYLAQRGTAKRIIASDIGECPLDSARKSAAEYGVEDKIRFVTASGLSGVGENGADTVVIAGMGGETIMQILGDAPWTLSNRVRLILQPQTKTDELYAWLLENGYAISDASLVYDAGRFYVIILAGVAGHRESGELPQDSGMPEDLLSVLARKGDPLFARYIEMLIKKTRRAVEGMESSANAKDEHLHMKARLERLAGLREDAGV